MNYNNTPTPIEGFCGDRTLMNFFVDIMVEPDTVKKAMDKVFEHRLAMEKEVERSNQNAPLHISS